MKKPKYRIKYRFCSHRGRTYADVYLLHKMHDDTVKELERQSWPQPIEGWDYPTGGLPGDKFSDMEKKANETRAVIAYAKALTRHINSIY